MILAAGHGKRLRPLTEHIPKPLISVGGKMLIDRHLCGLAQAGFSKVVINTSYMGDVIKEKVGFGARYGIPIVYSEEGDSRLNTGGGVKNALKVLGTCPFLLVSADVFTDWSFSQFCLPEDTAAHLLMVRRSGEPRESYFSLDHGGVSRISAPELVYSGIGFFWPKVFADIEKRIFSLRDALDAAVVKNTITTDVYDGCMVNVGTADDLRDARRRSVFGAQELS